MLIQDQFLADRRRQNVQSETKEKSKDVQNMSGEKLMFGVAVLFLGQLKHRLWVLLASLKSDQTILPLPMTFGGVRCLLVSDTAVEHTLVGRLSQNLFTKRAERGSQAEELQEPQIPIYT